MKRQTPVVREPEKAPSTLEELLRRAHNRDADRAEELQRRAGRTFSDSTAIIREGRDE